MTLETQLNDILLQNTSDAIILTDQKGLLCSGNPVFEKLTDAHPEEFYHHRFSEFFELLGDEEGNLADSIFPRVQRGFRVDIDHATLHVIKNDRRIPVAGQAFPIKSDSGKITQFALILHEDVTQIEARESGTLKSARLLRQKDAEIHALEAALKKAQQDLCHYQKSETLDKLAGTVGHDFNILLAGILSYANILKEELKDNAKISKRLSMMQKLAKRGVELAKQLFHLAQNNNGEKTRISLNDAIEEASNVLFHSINKNVTIKTALAQDLWPVDGNTSQIMQVLINLGLNAQDAMPDGGELLFETQNLAADERFCRIEPNLTPGDYVQLSVIDTGTGMSKDILPKIFDPFFTTRGYGNRAGLGLSVAHKIVQQHKGRVSVHSEPGRGAVFHLYFPASAGGEIIALRPKTPLPKTAKPASLAKSPFKGRVILAVDDDEVMRRFIRDTLKGSGAELLLAADCDQALRLVETRGKDIDLVLLDIIMPKADGVKTFRRLRKLQPKLKIVFTCGYGHASLFSELEKNEQVGFLIKPFAPEELARHFNPRPAANRRMSSAVRLST